MNYVCCMGGFLAGELVNTANFEAQGCALLSASQKRVLYCTVQLSKTQWSRLRHITVQKCTRNQGGRLLLARQSVQKTSWQLRSWQRHMNPCFTARHARQLYPLRVRSSSRCPGLRRSGTRICTPTRAHPRLQYVLLPTPYSTVQWHTVLCFPVCHSTVRYGILAMHAL